MEIQACVEGEVRPWSSPPTAVVRLEGIDLVIDVGGNGKIEHIPDHTDLEDRMDILVHTDLEGADLVDIRGRIHGRIDLIRGRGQKAQSLVDLNLATNKILASVKGGEKDVQLRTELRTSEGIDCEETGN